MAEISDKEIKIILDALDRKDREIEQLAKEREYFALRYLEMRIDLLIEREKKQ